MSNRLDISYNIVASPLYSGYSSPWLWWPLDIADRNPTGWGIKLSVCHKWTCGESTECYTKWKCSCNFMQL